MPNMKNIEEQIEKEQRNIKYDTKEYTIELIVKKYLEKIEEDENDFFVPDYQREFVWDDIRQSRFIESLFIGLPIPYIFLAENKEGRSEIVDGSQRIRTLAAFVTGELKLKGLEKLSTLNDMVFSELSKPYQRKFNNISLKMIALSEQTTEESKTDIFERINRGSDLLKDMEKRKGIYKGKFNDFIYKMAQDDRYKRLTPIAHWFEHRQEREELLLRFFALCDWYPRFDEKKGIAKQLDIYFEEKNHNFSLEERKRKEEDFHRVMDFVEKNCKYGFAKSNLQQVSRVYFEAVSVGVFFALKQEKEINITQDKMEAILTNKDFKELINGKYHTHKKKKIIARINYVKNKLVQSNGIH